MTYNFVNLTGKKVHRWRFKKYVGYGYWLAECECGKTKKVLGKNVRSGKSKSCGCYRAENTSNKTHGMTNTPVYFCWRNMINRCLNYKVDSYRSHGARGVRVSSDWRHSFAKFYEDFGKYYRPGMTIDRINNDGNYCKDNCRWATKKQQSRNKRRNRVIEFKGERKTLVEWSEVLGINYNTLQSRFSYGWSVEKSFTTPLMSKFRKTSYPHQT